MFNITKRDYFAAMLLRESGVFNNSLPLKQLIQTAYDMADVIVEVSTSRDLPMDTPTDAVSVVFIGGDLHGQRGSEPEDGYAKRYLGLEDAVYEPVFVHVSLHDGEIIGLVMDALTSNRHG